MRLRFLAQVKHRPFQNPHFRWYKSPWFPLSLQARTALKHYAHSFSFVLNLITILFVVLVTHLVHHVHF